MNNTDISYLLDINLLLGYGDVSKSFDDIFNKLMKEFEEKFKQAEKEVDEKN